MGAQVVSGVRWAMDGAKIYFAGTHPVILIGGTLVAWKTLAALNSLRDERTREWLWNKLTQRLLRVERFQTILNQKLAEQYASAAKSVKEKWAQFGDPFLKIPDEGIACGNLMRLIQKYDQITRGGLKDRHYSGTIYSTGLNGKALLPQKDLPDEPAEELEELYTAAFRCAHLWNPLHSSEFPIGTFLEYQVVQMVAELFGGGDVMGAVTSGGSESLMMAAKGYRNWGLERGIEPGESVIIAPDSIHAALIKACQDYHIRLILIPTDETGAVDMDKVETAVEKHQNNLVALFCSAPSYPRGKIDPVDRFGVLAYEYGVGCHADCCLGGFVVNFDPKLLTNYLQMLGITSLSACTHKNGWAPKGSSVQVAKELPKGKNLMYYSTYAVPDWTGGVYGTVKAAGSQSCLPALHALLAMLSMGKEGYRQVAQSILKSAQGMAVIVKAIPGLRLLGEPDLNVVAFQVDPALGLMPGASYAFAKEMEERGFVLNAIKGDAVHFCVTGRFVDDKEGLVKFEKAARESIEAVQKLNGEMVARGEKFSGDAGLYCELDAALNPRRETQGWKKYIENTLFGEAGVAGAVKSHLLAYLNPHREAAPKRRNLRVEVPDDHED